MHAANFLAGTQLACAADAGVDIIQLVGRLVTKATNQNMRHILHRLAMDAPDWQQEVLVRCWTAYGAEAEVPRGHCIGALVPVVATVVRRSAADLHDRAVRRPVLEAIDASPVDMTAANNPETTAAARQDLRHVLVAVRRLTPGQHAALRTALDGWHAPLAPGERQALARARRSLGAALADVAPSPAGQAAKPRALQSRRITAIGTRL